jgi:hypothetical protein
MQALMEAFFAGYLGQSIDKAMAVEAFGGHFLTDAFSGGHIRTPRASASEHWNKLEPMFNYNLKGWMAQSIAENLGPWTEIAYSGPPWGPGALQIVTAKLDAKGKLSFGDVVSGAIHDYDNKNGVAATVAGIPAKLKGDSHLGEGDEKTFAIDAVRLAVQDVQMAWTAGQKKDNPLSLIAALMQDGLFAAETLLPKPVADADLPPGENKAIKWDYDDVGSLLGDPQFHEALKIFAGEKASELKEIAADLDKDQQDAFQKGVVDPLVADPAATLRKIIYWTPDTGGGFLGHNQDDNALDYYEAAKAEGALGTLSVGQKVKLILDLLDGPTIGDEEDAIMGLLLANTNDAKFLIKQIGWDRLEDDIDDGPGSEFADNFPEDVYK